MAEPVVITGARGYIASALAGRLERAGYALRLVSRSLNLPPMAKELGRDYRGADLRNPESWSKLLRDAEVVVHVSSGTDLRAAEADPADDEDINVRPLRALVEAARALDRVPRIVFASAATIVGLNPQIPVD